MNPDDFKTTTLSIAVAGLLVLLTGVILYLFRDTVSESVRFFLPVPPLAVAAYIFVFNLYSYFDGQLPGVLVAAKEILLGMTVAAVSFGLFALLITVIIEFIRQ